MTESPDTCRRCDGFRHTHLSDREHGRRCAVDGKTVAVVRESLVRSAEIPHFDKRQDSAGRQQPSRSLLRPMHPPNEERNRP